MSDGKQRPGQGLKDYVLETLDSIPSGAKLQVQSVAMVREVTPTGAAARSYEPTGERYLLLAWHTEPGEPAPSMARILEHIVRMSEEAAG